MVTIGFFDTIIILVLAGMVLSAVFLPERFEEGKQYVFEKIWNKPIEPQPGNFTDLGQPYNPMNQTFFNCTSHSICTDQFGYGSLCNLLNGTCYR